MASRFIWSSSIAILLLTAPVSAEKDQEKKSKENLLGDESVLDQEQEYPDLVRGDETGGVMDEFAFLDDVLAYDEVVSASKHRQSIFWSPSSVTDRSIWPRKTCRPEPEARC